jgi:hypothetical protein
MAMIKTNIPNKIAIAHTTEVLVIGGGPGGIGAAVAAARKGKEVLLVEHYGFLGGMATAGEVNPFMPNALHGENLDIGIFTEWLECMREYGGVADTEDKRTFDPNAAKLAAEDLCLEAGVKLLYHHRLAGVAIENRQITGVTLHSKSGYTGVKADIYIDSTGDGDLAAMAGNTFEFGGEGTPYVQPMTTCFKVKLDPASIEESFTEYGDNPAESNQKGNVRSWILSAYDEIQSLYSQAQQDGFILKRAREVENYDGLFPSECRDRKVKYPAPWGGIEPPKRFWVQGLPWGMIPFIKNTRENVLMFRAVDSTVIHFNTTRIIKKSPIDGEQLSAAEIEARGQIRRLLQLLQENITLFKNLRIYSIAAQIGMRESRRVIGRFYLTREHFSRGATFSDGIARVTYPIDIHSPVGRGTEITWLPKDRWLEIPYTCLVPKDIDNLLIACRAISVDHGVHSACRIMPVVVSIGQAAGTAAAMAVDSGLLPYELDGEKLKQQLIAAGRNLI